MKTKKEFEKIEDFLKWITNATNDEKKELGSLSLEDCIKNDQDLKKITKTLTKRKLSNLTELYLPYNSLTWKKIKTLCDLFTKQNIQLKKLDLGNNELDDSGESIIKNLLKNQKNLKILHLEWNKVNDENNSIGEKVVRGIVEGAFLHKSIITIEFRGINLTNSCFEYLKKLLPFIKNIDIGYNAKLGGEELLNFLFDIYIEYPIDKIGLDDIIVPQRKIVTQINEIGVKITGNYKFPVNDNIIKEHSESIYGSEYL
jgi:hypothetical protein